MANIAADTNVQNWERDGIPSTTVRTRMQRSKLGQHVWGERGKGARGVGSSRFLELTAKL